MTTTGWGGASWGGSAWGDGGAPTFEFASIFPHRENVLRVGFTSAPLVNFLLNDRDSLNVAKYIVTQSGIGLDEQPARAVRVVEVVVATEMVAPEAEGMFLDLILDRPMSPWPCQYSLSYLNLYSADGLTTLTGTASTESVFRRIQQPTLDSAQANADIANAQVASDGTAYLGVNYPAEDGDYAADHYPASLKKRILRVLVTKKNAYAHLPGFGVGIPQEGKRLARPGVLEQKAAEAEIQISRDPDVRSVRVTTRLVQTKRGTIAWFRVAIVPRLAGRTPVAFNYPFPILDTTG